MHKKNFGKKKHSEWYIELETTNSTFLTTFLWYHYLSLTVWWSDINFSTLFYHVFCLSIFRRLAKLEAIWTKIVSFFQLAQLFFNLRYQQHTVCSSAQLQQRFASNTCAQRRSFILHRPTPYVSSIITHTMVYTAFVSRYNMNIVTLSILEKNDLKLCRLRVRASTTSLSRYIRCLKR